MASNLVEEIQKIQKLKGLSDGKLAKELGIDPGLWSKIKNGKANPGGKFLRGVARVFPELYLSLRDHLAGV